MNDIDIKQTIDFWESWLNQKKSANIGEFMMYGGRSLDVCKTYLQEKAARENPQPLTLEQLKERVGRPVYAQSELLPGESHWCILDETLAFGGGFTLVAIYGRNLTLAESDYGRTWFAYDHEPKEVER